MLVFCARYFFEFIVLENFRRSGCSSGPDEHFEVVGCLGTFGLLSCACLVSSPPGCLRRGSKFRPSGFGVSSSFGNFGIYLYARISSAPLVLWFCFGDLVCCGF